MIRNCQDGPKYPELGLVAWPFQVVPDEASSKTWAGRPDLQKLLSRLLHKWSRVDSSSIHLMWADLGAGKSHTLMHLKNRCLNDQGNKILPVYSVVPKQPKNFLDLYRAIISGLDFTEFHRMTLVVTRQLNSRSQVVKQIFPEIPDAVSALFGLQADNERVRNLSQQWIRGTTGMIKKDLNELGVTRRITTTDDAVAMLGGLIKLVEVSGRYSRVVILLDECQRMFRASPKIGQDINTGLQTWFDSSPKNLSLLLSFGSGEEKFVRSLLSPELRSREDPTSISIPLLGKDEAYGFVVEVLGNYHTEDAPTATYPFKESQIKLITDWLCRDEKVTPRVIMKCFDSVLTEIDFLMQSGESDQMTDEEIRQIIDTAREEDANAVEE